MTSETELHMHIMMEDARRDDQRRMDEYQRRVLLHEVLAATEPYVQPPAEVPKPKKTRKPEAMHRCPHTCGCRGEPPGRARIIKSSSLGQHILSRISHPHHDPSKCVCPLMPKTSIVEEGEDSDHEVASEPIPDLHPLPSTTPPTWIETQRTSDPVASPATTATPTAAAAHVMRAAPLLPPLAALHEEYIQLMPPPPGPQAASAAPAASTQPVAEASKPPTVIDIREEDEMLPPSPTLDEDDEEEDLATAERKVKEEAAKVLETMEAATSSSSSSHPDVEMKDEEKPKEYKCPHTCGCLCQADTTQVWQEPRVFQARGAWINHITSKAQHPDHTCDDDCPGTIEDKSRKPKRKEIEPAAAASISSTRQSASLFYTCTHTCGCYDSHGRPLDGPLRTNHPNYTRHVRNSVAHPNHGKAGCVCAVEVDTPIVHEAKRTRRAPLQIAPPAAAASSVIVAPSPVVPSAPPPTPAMPQTMIFILPGATSFTSLLQQLLPGNNLPSLLP